LGKLNNNVDALSRMYNISEIKEERYENFMQKSITTVICNKNVTEVKGDLINSSSEYSIVSEKRIGTYILLI